MIWNLFERVKDKNMNATSAACCAGADDDDDDEDGEAADMEGTSHLYLTGKQASRFDRSSAQCFLSFQNMRRAACWKQMR